ncbi:MAG: PEP-CTERM sorting domain-containing protein [Oxalobacteraceae bacterium]|nr:MAG: PEP-CTERM sorting domain-containing protein [Oxalobacteraceae bacterium]
MPVSGFAANLGSYGFTLTDDPLFVPTVELYNAFSFFGGTSSEAVLIANFYLVGTIKPTGSTASPFPIPSGVYDTLVLSAVFRTGDVQVPLGFDQFRDPSLAATRSFSYGVIDRDNRKSGRLTGSYDGGFSSVAAVPEPATWSMMLVGFALLGAALRLPRCRRVYLPA